MTTSDVVTLLIALYLAFVLRLGEPLPIDYIYESWWIFLSLPLVMIPLFVKLGLYRAVLQYMGIKVINTTFKVTTISCLLLMCLLSLLVFCLKECYIHGTALLMKENRVLFMVQEMQVCN